MKKAEKNKHEKEDTKKELKDSLRDLAHRGLAIAKEEHRSRLGRWANVMNALENVVDATLDVAEDAVRGVPRQLAKVQHVRRAASARFAGVDEEVDTLDLLFTVGLLVRLAESEFGELGLSTLQDALLSRVDARCPSERFTPTVIRFV